MSADGGTLVLRNVRVVDTTGDATATLVIRDGVVAERRPATGGSGLMVLPSVLDAHVHFRQPGGEAAEDWAKAAAAAFASGVTHVLDMPNNDPVTDSVERLKAKRLFAEPTGLGYGFFVAATDLNVDRLAEMVPPAAAVKLFCSETTGVWMQPDPAFWRRVLACGRTVAAHAEDGRLLPPGTAHELRTVDVVLSCLDELLAAAVELGPACRLVVCHVTSVAELERIAAARARGAVVFSEVTPHHLLLSSEDSLGVWGKVNPPLRSRSEADALVAALSRGEVDLVASDHAPHTRAAKVGARPPSGMPGVGTLLPTLLTLAAQGRIPFGVIPRVTAAGPARAYGLPPRGALTVGAPADLVVVDPEEGWTLEDGDVRCGGCGWSAYTGRRFTGRVKLTLRQGRVEFEEGARG